MSSQSLEARPAPETGCALTPDSRLTAPSVPGGPGAGQGHKPSRVGLGRPSDPDTEHKRETVAHEKRSLANPLETHI